VRAEKNRKDEIGVLFNAFNNMLETVQRREEQLVQAKQKAEDSALEARELLAGISRMNADLEQEVMKRRRMENELKQHRAQLELTVENRTAQLTETNLRLQREVEEKVVLLGEVHHRVKNNLQIIASLLEMSKSRVRSPEAAEQLGEAHGKIFTMALIHSQLYQNERFDEIDMERHARELFTHLASLYGRKKPASARIMINGLRLPVTQAIPCALVLNELVSNAFKYAFDGSREGHVKISMEQKTDGTVELEVADDGPGIPPHIDILQAQSLGLKLVRNIVNHQLKGSLDFGRGPGARVLITFPVFREAAFDAQDSSG
jgi:two-component sensor histidine kinase